MGILRPLFARERIGSCREITGARDAAFVRTAGVVLVRQRPGKGNAIFMTLEDETGIVNVVLWARQFERFRRQIMGARLLQVSGRIQRSVEGVVHLMATDLVDRTRELQRLSEDYQAQITLSRADEFAHPQHPRGPSTGPGGHPRHVRILPKSRDFH